MTSAPTPLPVELKEDNFLHVVQSVCTQMAAIWPLFSIGILTFSEQAALEARSAEDQAESFCVEWVSGEVEMKRVVRYLEQIIQVLKENKVFYQNVAKDVGLTLLAAAPFGFMKGNTQNNGPEDSFDTSRVNQAKKHLVITLWSDSGNLPNFTDKEKLIFQLLNNQLNHYCHLSDSLVIYDRLLHKFRHDLRTPLTSISMIGGLLEQETDTELNEMGKMLHTAAANMDLLLKTFKNNKAGD